MANTTITKPIPTLQHHSQISQPRRHLPTVIGLVGLQIYIFVPPKAAVKTLARSLPDIRDTSFSSQLAGDRVCYRQRQRDNACGQSICDVAFYIQNALHN